MSGDEDDRRGASKARTLDQGDDVQRIDIDGVDVVLGKPDASLVEKHKSEIGAVVTDVISGERDKAVGSSIKLLFAALGIPIVGTALSATYARLAKHSSQAKLNAAITQQDAEDAQRKLIMGAVLPTLRSVWTQMKAEFIHLHERHDISQDLQVENQTIGLANLKVGQETNKIVREMAKQQQRSPARRSPEKHNLPYERNPEFVGRTEELARLTEHLDHHQVVALNQARVTPGALTGMGGVGKTQIAIKYAYDHLDDYTAVCWVDAEGADITAAFAELARRPLQLGLPPTLPVEDTASAVRHRLERIGKYLLILDNVSHPTAWRRWAPTTGGTRILITTRRASLRTVRIISVETLPRANSLELIQGEQPYSGEELVAANQLCDDLGDLAIALAVVRGLLDEPGPYHRSPLRLLAALREAGPVEWSQAHANEDTVPFHNKPDLLRLFDASVALLDDASPHDSLARAMLWAGGWLAPVAIAPELLRDAAARLCGREVSKTDAQVASTRLVRLGLANMSPEGEVSLHRLTRAYARERGGAPASLAVLEVLGAVAKATPIDTLALLALATVRPHLEAAVDLLDEGSPETHLRVALRLAQHYKHAALYGLSLRVCRQMTRMIDGKWASYFLNEAGQALHRQGKYDEALRYYERSLAIKEKTLGPEHPETAITRVSMGQTMHSLNLAGWREIMEFAAKSLETHLGPEHPTTITARREIERRT